jgi:hypothetical protein
MVGGPSPVLSGVAEADANNSLQPMALRADAESER